MKFLGARLFFYVYQNSSNYRDLLIYHLLDQHKHNHDISYVSCNRIRFNKIVYLTKQQNAIFESLQFLEDISKMRNGKFLVFGYLMR